MPSGLSRLPMVTKTMPRNPCRLVLEEPRPAVRTEVAVESVAGVGDIVERSRLAADQGEIILGNCEPGDHRAAAGLAAVQAIAIGDEGRIGIELEFDCAACALRRILLRHMYLLDIT